jgi:hypothetical protein
MNVQAGQALPLSSSLVSLGGLGGTLSNLGNVEAGRDCDRGGVETKVLDGPAIVTASDLLERGTPHSWHVNFGARSVSTFLLPHISHSQRMNDVSLSEGAAIGASPAAGLASAGFEGWIGEERNTVTLGDDVRKPA